MEFVLAALVLAAIVALVVTVPLRRSEERARVEEDRRAALEAAKEQKYRDIRDAELDYRMGKLSETDWREADRELRTQAIAILRDLDALDGRDGAAEG
jgi:type II secretory pathway component PulJ